MAQMMDPPPKRIIREDIYPIESLKWSINKICKWIRKGKEMIENDGMLSHFIEMSILKARLEKIELVLINVFDNDDENVVSLIVNDIRKIDGLEDFAHGAHSDDHIKLSDPCPYCGSVHVDDKIGYSESFENKISIKLHMPDWMFPHSFCKCCERYFNYEETV